MVITLYNYYNYIIKKINIKIDLIFEIKKFENKYLKIITKKLKTKENKKSTKITNSNSKLKAKETAGQIEKYQDKILKITLSSQNSRNRN